MAEVIITAEVRVKYSPIPRYGRYGKHRRKSFRADLFVGAVRVGDYTEVTLVTANNTPIGQAASPFYMVRCEDSPAEIEAAVKEGMIIHEAIQAALKEHADA